MKTKLIVICLLLLALLAFSTFFAALIPKDVKEAVSEWKDDLIVNIIGNSGPFGPIHFIDRSSSETEAPGTETPKTEEPETEEPETEAPETEEPETEAPETEEPETEAPETEEPETEETEAEPTDGNVFTLADEEVLYGARLNNSGADGAAFVLYCSQLKANTNYKVKWSVDSTFYEYGFSFKKSGFYYAVSYTVSPSELYQDEYTFFIHSYDTYTDSINFTTTDEGYFELLLFTTEDATGEAASERFDDFLSLINYFEIEEVAAS